MQPIYLDGCGPRVGSDACVIVECSVRAAVRPRRARPPTERTQTGRPARLLGIKRRFAS